MKLDDVLHINTKELDNITVNGETARWSSLMLGIDHIDQRARELKMDLDKDKSWLKPLALQKYIEESTPGMVAEIKNLKENGDVL